MLPFHVIDEGPVDIECFITFIALQALSGSISRTEICRRLVIGLLVHNLTVTVTQMTRRILGLFADSMDSPEMDPHIGYGGGGKVTSTLMTSLRSLLCLVAMERVVVSMGSA